MLAPRVTRDSVAVWQAAIGAGWSVERLSSWRVPQTLRSIIRKGRDVVVYAEPLFAEAVADQLGLTLMETPADWLTTVPAKFLRREIGFTLLSQAQKLRGSFFVKPAEGKVFEPGIFVNGDRLPFIEKIGDIPVLTSTPVDWMLEVRCFVRDRRVMTMSPYCRDGALAQDKSGKWPFLKAGAESDGEGEEDGARAFMTAFLNDAEVQLPPACVVDIGLIEGKGWAVIEANPCWGAGLYGCEVFAALQTIRRAVFRSRDNVALEDQPWMAVRNKQPVA
ncbi:MAG TPA: ATP-grasp domain-containing protein [Candidatus Methylacidiphilales bacterium]|nr:ATP-grasp domain-containing protein [Candidatus Methylacidiphilales bacterium]